MKKIRYIIAFLLSVIMILSFTACNSIKSLLKIDDLDPVVTLDTIKQRGTLRVGIKTDMEPNIIITENNEVDGFDATLVTKVAEEMGVTVDFVVLPSIGDVYSALHNGTIDCYWCSYTATDDRKKSLSLSIPYMYSKPIFVTKNNAKNISFDLEKHMTIGYETDSSMQTIIFSPSNSYLRRQYSFIAFAGNNELFSALKTEKVDAIITDTPIAMYMESRDSSISIPLDPDSLKKGVKEPITIDKEGTASKLVVAFNRSSIELKDYINTEIEKFSKNGFIRELSYSYFSRDLSAIKADDNYTP